jgi:hypothetical protein
MSDSRNVRFVQSDLYFYTHYNAYSLENDLRHAIKDSEGRWSDTEYFTRFVIGNLCAPYNNNLTGAGMGVGSGTITDYPDILVDTVMLTVDGIPFADFVKER